CSTTTRSRPSSRGPASSCAIRPCPSTPPAAATPGPWCDAAGPTRCEAFASADVGGADQCRAHPRGEPEPGGRAIDGDAGLVGEGGGVRVGDEAAVAALDLVEDELPRDEVLPVEVPVLVLAMGPVLAADEHEVAVEPAVGHVAAVRLGVGVAKRGEP